MEMFNYQFRFKVVLWVWKIDKYMINDEYTVKYWHNVYKT